MIYIQKFIKTEDDLPKEDGKYYVHVKSRDIVELWTFSKKFYNHAFDHIDWYLLPVELPTDKEIETFSDKYWTNYKSKIAFIEGEKYLRHKLMGK